MRSLPGPPGKRLRLDPALIRAVWTRSATEQWAERIKANPRNRDYLRRLPPEKFIDVLTKWREIFVTGAHLPVLGVTAEELASIKVPTIVIPGNDKVHSSSSGIAAHRLIPGCQMHRLPIEDQEIPLIPFSNGLHMKTRFLGSSLGSSRK